MITSKFIIESILEVSQSPSKIADEILSRYPNKDFKQVISDLSIELGISKLKLIQIFCNQTGTDVGNLPGDYSLDDFVKKLPKDTQDKDEKPPEPFQLSSPTSWSN